jgi:hypothetical protein
MGAPFRLPQELRHVELICMADRWAWPPLAAWAAPVTCGSKPFVTLDMQHMILGAVYKRSSLHLFDSINSRVPGNNYFIRPILNLL